MTVEQEREAELRSQATGSYYLRRLLGLFSNIRLTIALLVLIAAVSLAGALIPQAPAGIEAYPAQYAQWLQEMRGRYGSAANAFFALGFFDLYSAWWFKSLLGLLTLNVVVCTLNRLPTIIRSVFAPKARLGDSFYDGMPNRVSLPFEDGITQALSSTLSGLRYKVFAEKDGGTTYLYADKHGWAKLGTLATHTAIAMALVTIMVGGVMGFAEDGLVVPEGQSMEIGHDTGLTVRNDSAAFDPGDDKLASDYRSVVTMSENGREVKQQIVRVNEPLSHNGVRLYQMGHGALATIEVKDPQGRLVQSTEMNLEPGKSDYFHGDFQVLGTDLVLAGLLPKGDRSSRQGMTLFAVRGNTEIASFKLDPGRTQIVEGYLVTLTDSGEYAVLRVVKDPGSPIIWIASPLFILGISLTLYLPRRRIWARIDSHEVLLTGAGDRMVRFPQELEEIADKVRTAAQPLTDRPASR